MKHGMYCEVEEKFKTVQDEIKQTLAELPDFIEKDRDIAPEDVPPAKCGACGSKNTDRMPVIGYGWLIECLDCGLSWKE